MTSSIDPPPGAATTSRARRAASLSSPSLTHSMVYSIGSSGGTLVLQLLTGVLTARLLGTAGRGEIEAVMSWVNLSAIVFAFGFGPGLAFQQARRAIPSASLFSSGLVGVAVLGSIGVIVTQLLVPIGFSEQRDDVVDLARIAMFGIFAVMGTHLVRTLMAANNFFRPVSLNTVGQPLIYAVAAVVVWAAGSYTVGAIVAIQIASFAAMFLVGVAILWSVSGTARTRSEEVKSATSYGLRSYPATLSRLANARLDVVLLPAFVVADEIGLYVVAVSVGSMMIALFQQLNRVMFTSVARAPEDQRVALVERIVRVVGIGAGSLGLFLMLVGPRLITWVYGAEFAGSATPLRLLLPGLVLWACGNVMGGALSGLGWPGRTSLAQIIGLVITVVGLSIALGPFGITGAAVVSTIAYTSVSVVTATFLRRHVGVSFRRIVSLRLARSDLRTVLRRVGRRVNAKRSR